MSKFIKVTGTNGKKFLLPIHEIQLIYPDVDQGSVLGSEIMRYKGDRVLVKETVEQIEDQLLRDEFAKHALSGFCADREMSTEGTIRLPYEYADAMLKERSK